MKIIPLKGHIFLEPVEIEMKSSAGIILEGIDKKVSKTRGVVIAVGPEVDAVKVGQTVLFKPFAPQEIELASKKFLVAATSDIVGIIQP